MNRLVWIITLPIALLVTLFALMNRQEVVLSLWPLPWDTPPLTLSLLLFATGVLGFLIGASSAWVSGGSARHKLRAANRALAESKDEIARLKRRLTTPADGQQITQLRPPTPPPAA